MKISVVIHTFNSGKTLDKVLASVKDFDEIIVCDMYSEDNTLSIAQKYNCRIIMHERCGFVEPARNMAIQSASHEWVLVVDSDEVVPNELKELLYAIIKQNNPAEAYRIPQKNYFMGRFMHASYPDYHIRFLQKSKAYWPPYIHSTPEINGRIAKIASKHKYALIHLDDPTISSLLSKINTYTDKELFKRQNEKTGITGLIMKSFFRFFSYYILKGGFRDGRAGFIYACFNAIYKFTTVVKIWEKHYVELRQGKS